MTNHFAGGLQLLRLNLRRDRWQILIWLAALTFLSVAVARGFPELFVSEGERLAMAETLKNPAMIAMIGPSNGFDNYTIGAMYGHEMTLFMGIAAAIMTIMLTSSQTRGAEEDGRLELLQALPVGRLANLAAVVVEMLLISLSLTLLIGMGIGFLGIESMDVYGALTYGAALGMTAFVFASSTVVFAQLTTTLRGTLGLSLAFLGGAYLWRALTDVEYAQLSWVSPLAWSYKTEPFVNNHWLPIILGYLVAILLFGLAFYLKSIRDVGARLLPAKKGKGTASRWLQRPIGLTFYLNKLTIISWGVGMFVLGLSYGSIFGDLESFFESSELYMMLLPQDSNFSLTEQFMTVLMVILAIMSTIPTVTVVLKLYSEEKKGHLEQVMAKAVSRKELFLSYWIIAWLTGLVIQLMAVLGLYVAASSVMDEGIPFLTMLQAGLVYLPAIWFTAGLVFFVDYLGNMLSLPTWISKLSVFGYISKRPVETLNLMPMVLLLCLAVALGSIGLTKYRQRDLVA